MTLNGTTISAATSGTLDEQHGLILASADVVASGDDVYGYLVVNAIIVVTIGLLVPAVQKPSSIAGARASTSGSVRL